MSQEMKEIMKDMDEQKDELRLYTYLAYVTKVYDGDTITVSISVGFDIWKTKEKIRLFGINTKEVRGKEREEGLKVRDYVSDLIFNKSIILQTIKDKKGKYGRYLGNIFYETEDGNWENLNKHLLEKGFAEKYIP